MKSSINHAPTQKADSKFLVHLLSASLHPVRQNLSVLSRYVFNILVFSILVFISLGFSDVGFSVVGFSNDGFSNDDKSNTGTYDLDMTSALLAVADVRSRICVWMGSRRRSGSFPAEVPTLPLVALRHAV